jgi:transcriptional regulator with XRE-family HTH domain
MKTNKETASLVNQILDQLANAEGLTTERELARRIGVTEMSIFRWRRGEIGKAARLLLPLAIGQQPPAAPPNTH